MQSCYRSFLSCCEVTMREPCFAAGLKALSSHMVDPPSVQNESSRRPALSLKAICLAKPVCLSSQLWPLCRPCHFLGLRTMQILIPAIAV